MTLNRQLLLTSASLATLAASLLFGCGGLTTGADSAETGGTAGNPSGGAAGSVGGAGGSSGSSNPNLPEKNRKLDSLSPSELEEVCLEDVRRTDLCVQAGMEHNTRAACEEEVSRCREKPPVDEAIAKCKTLRDITDCPVTVAEYFACLDAWNETQTCEFAGRMINTPEACVKVAKCEDFKFTFEQFGMPRPCAPETLVPKPPDTNDDIHGADGCYPIPARFVVFGNSVATWGGELSAGALLATYIKQTYAPALEYQSHAANGDLGDFENLGDQLRNVEPGGGHVALWIYSLPTDPHSSDYDLWIAQLNVVFDYFNDRAKFPDGASFLLNTQYSPSDQCPNKVWGLFPPLTPEEDQLLQEINRKLFIELGLVRPDALTIDHYPDWLGHAGNADSFGCPHCSSDNTSYMADPVHPNDVGRTKIADKWKIAVDRMYGGSCH